jgi:hypothetical protein
MTWSDMPPPRRPVAVSSDRGGVHRRTALHLEASSFVVNIGDTEKVLYAEIRVATFEE